MMFQVTKGYIYQIRVNGGLSDHWSDWFDGMTVHKHKDGETILTGILSDQAALMGVLNKIHGLNLDIISVNRSSMQTTQNTLHFCRD